MYIPLVRDETGLETREPPFDCVELLYPCGLYSYLVTYRSKAPS